MTNYTESTFGIIINGNEFSTDNGASFHDINEMSQTEITELKEACMDWATNGNEGNEQIQRMRKSLDEIIDALMAYIDISENCSNCSKKFCPFDAKIFNYLCIESCDSYSCEEYE